LQWHRLLRLRSELCIHCKTANTQKKIDLQEVLRKGVLLKREGVLPMYPSPLQNRIDLSILRIHPSILRIGVLQNRIHLQKMKMHPSILRMRVLQSRMHLSVLRMGVLRNRIHPKKMKMHPSNLRIRVLQSRMHLSVLRIRP